MTTAIVKPGAYPEEKIVLMKRLLCPDLTDEELDLFAAQCARTGLDPFSRQIHATKRRDRRAGTDKLTIQVGIDGFRLIAARTGELDGQDGPYWCGQDGNWSDVWLKDHPPAAAKVVVFRKGARYGFVGIARWSEYAQQWDGKPSGLWGKMPGTMLAKCAEALALRKAFPQDLSGLYAPEEMEQADAPEPEPVKATVTAAKVDKPKAVAAKPEPETVTKGDPATDRDALVKLLARKGWDWAEMVRDVNDRFGKEYSITQTRWGDIDRDIREQVVAGLNRLPDPEQTGPDAVQSLIGKVAQMKGLEPSEVLHKMCAALGWEGVTSYSDLTLSQCATACSRLRATLSQAEGK